MGPAGFSHSDIRGSSGHVPLTAAYRSLSRPSSAPCAKASAVCPCHLAFRQDGPVHTQAWGPACGASLRCDLVV